MLKRILSGVLIAVLLLLSLPCAASADTEPQFELELYMDGQKESRAEPGDVITIALYLHRTDSQERYNMYGMQAEIRYNTDFFRLVGDSYIHSPGIVCQNVSGVGQHDEVYMNFLSITGEDMWEAKKFIGSFQLEVISDSGVSKITLEDSLIAQQDGAGVYDCTEVEHTVIVSTDCTIIFESNGGSPVQDMIVVYGEKMPKPQDPVREGYIFAGWYKDIHLQDPWNFETDIVEGSVALYAKWIVDENYPGETTQPTDITDTTEPSVNKPILENNTVVFWGLMALVLLAAVCIILMLIYRKKSEDKPDQQEENEPQ
ncbi:MAG: InlB B-repeat-containing protein [Oscillospiraceae bacterium]|nr:InlB B-repeat-containing protein [Oscillospiraceae bacterium]MBQ4642528.1 InlB B-repeat-containing protein [Oscillospiraceae bacterium]